MVMQKRNTGKKENKGFTLIELIIVVAILAILVGILAPQYTKYVEKSRQSTDMNNAKAIETTLRLALTMDEIQIPVVDRQNNSYGAWVMICRGKEYAPSAYRDKNCVGDQVFDTMWCGADQGVAVNGISYKDDWTYNKQLESILEESGINSKSLRTYSSGKNNGWDWIIIQVGYTKERQIFSRIYSGFKNDNGGVNKTSLSNIEKLMYGKK